MATQKQRARKHSRRVHHRDSIRAKAALRKKLSAHTKEDLLIIAHAKGARFHSNVRKSEVVEWLVNH